MKKIGTIAISCALLVLFLAFADRASGQTAAPHRSAIQKPPSIFVGTSVGGSADPYFFCNPYSMKMLNSGGNTYTDNVTGAVYNGPVGPDIFVSNGLSGDISRGRLVAGNVRWETLITFTSGPTAPDGAYGVDYDRTRKKIWTMANPWTGQRELVSVDVDRKSPTYGQVLEQTSGVSAIGWAEIWALDRTKTLAAVPEAVAFSSLPQLHIWDLDPTSPRYLQITEYLIVPVRAGAPFVLIPDVEFTNDGSELLVLVQVAGGDGEIARFSFKTGQWIDHDPSTPSVVDNLGPWSVPPIPIGTGPTSIDASPKGNFFSVSGIDNQGWAGRLDLDPQNPMSYSWTFATGAYLPNAWDCCVFGGGTGVAVVSWSPPELKLFDAATMTYNGSIMLPGAGNIYTCVPSW